MNFSNSGSRVVRVSRTISAKQSDSFSLALHKKAAFWLYNLCWTLAIPGLRFNPRLAQGFKQRTLQSRALNSAGLWIQAASVGEAFLALELLKHLKPQKPLRLLMTSNTRQGFEILTKAMKEPDVPDTSIQAQAAYFPFDKPGLMEKAVQYVSPRLMVLLETEIWPGLLRALKYNNCKILIINGRLRQQNLKRYLLWPSIWQSLKPDKIMAMSEDDAARFAKLFGKEVVSVMPNMKFDRIGAAESLLAGENPLDDILPSGVPMVVLGSIRREEEQQVENIILEILRQRPDAVIGLFPRHLDRVSQWSQALNRAAGPWTLRSQTKDRISPGTVILWDTFGELLAAYARCRAAFVGGSLVPLGGQNYLEALTCGVIPVIGPFWDNFAWVGSEIVEHGLVQQATDWKDVAQRLVKYLLQPRSRQEVIKKARRYIQDRQGGTELACREIMAFLQNP